MSQYDMTIFKEYKQPTTEDTNKYISKITKLQQPMGPTEKHW